MQLSLEQAAARMGKSVRQVRYMIQRGQLRARKDGGRWVVDSDSLRLDEGAQNTKTSLTPVEAPPPSSSN